MDGVKNRTVEYVGMYGEYQVPFCRPFQCLLTVETGQNEDKIIFVNGKVAENTLWDCLPPDCQTNLTGLLLVIVMLAVMTITFNCLILGINLASKTRRMRKRNPTINNYSTYVVSLAIADLLLGVAVLPLCVVNFYIEFLSNPIKTIDAAKSDAPGRILYLQEIATNKTNVGIMPELSVNYGDKDVVTIGVSVTPGFNSLIIADHERSVILEMLGFFTHLTLFVSVYTLISASADRFYAASHSMRLHSSRQSRSTGETKAVWMRRTLPTFRRSTLAVCLVWILGLVFAMMPLVMRPYFYFRHVGHIFAAMTSDVLYSTGIKLYLFTLMLPLIGMWALNVMICFTLWRRKSQLGLRRKQSLHRKLFSGGSTPATNSPVPRLDSASNSVFESRPSEKSKADQKYPASRWDQADTNIGKTETKGTVKTFAVANKSKVSGGGFPISPTSNQASQSGSRPSTLLRRVSSIRRAKEILRNQSYEANITKTLCIVVIAFTIAVLPLIVVLGRVAEERDSSPETLNKEVTALTCCALLLFSNSFVNCVIYGARMRDFRTAVAQMFRAFFFRIKTTFCCSCLRSGGSQPFVSDGASGVFHFGRSHGAESSPRQTWDCSRVRQLKTSDGHSNKGDLETCNLRQQKPLTESLSPLRVELQDMSSVIRPHEHSRCTNSSDSLDAHECTEYSEKQKFPATFYTRRQYSSNTTATISLSRSSWRSGSVEDERFEMLMVQKRKPLSPLVNFKTFTGNQEAGSGSNGSDIRPVFSSPEMSRSFRADEAGLKESDDQIVDDVFFTTCTSENVRDSMCCSQESLPNAHDGDSEPFFDVDEIASAETADNFDIDPDKLSLKLSD